MMQSLASGYPIRLSAGFLVFPGHPRAALQPRFMRFGLFPLRSPLLRESLLISFPGLLRWFTSPSLTSVPYFIQVFRWHNHSCRITPFGHPGVNGYVLLTPAFRSLSRPSSPYSSTGIRHEPIFHLTILSFSSCTLLHLRYSSGFLFMSSVPVFHSLHASCFFILPSLIPLKFPSLGIHVSFLHFYCQRTRRKNFLFILSASGE